MAKPEIVSAEQWQQAHDELLAEEKKATRALDALAARRRQQPMMRFGTGYKFEGPAGPVTLLDLFDGRDLLVTYQHMDNGPGNFCGGCTAFSDNVTDLKDLAAAGISWATVSTMPIAQIEARKADRGWTMPFVSSRGTTFAEDTGAGGGFVLCSWLRDGDEVYLTYSTTSRGVDRLLFTNSIKDLTVYGRQEDWEDSPAGWPQHPTYG
jgi:predicted dithiol-disulfide oxidoreductase (DUF899 family)